MIFLFGDQIKTRPKEQGQFNCPVCDQECAYTRFEERSWFSVFGVPILSISRLANYCQCSVCGNSYEPGCYTEPALDRSLRRVLAYIAMGYAMQERVDSMIELFTTLTARTCTELELVDEQQAIREQGGPLHDYLHQQSQYLNIQARQKILEGAFLMTYICCELQHEDRLRINLIGAALGVSLEFVESVINHLRSQGYYGIQRMLAVH